MEFLETSIFTKLIHKLLDEENYAHLQSVLSLCPEVGPVIPGSGGLRKIRWKMKGKGKRGGLRVIYYWMTQNHKILMLYVYQKNKSENLTKEQIRVLKNIIKREYDG